MYFFTFLPDKPDPFPVSFCHIRTVSCHRIQGQLPYDVKLVKGISMMMMMMRDDVKATYIWLSGTLAVVTSPLLEALQDYLQLLWMSDAVYNQKSIPWYGCIPPSCICVNTRAWHHSFFHGCDLCHT